MIPNYNNYAGIFRGLPFTSLQDVEDHCCLLCSLLLGYGLEAYVCVGSKTQGLAHCWVVTVGGEGGRVTFWESLTGQRWAHSLKGEGRAGRRVHV